MGQGLPPQSTHLKSRGAHLPQLSLAVLGTVARSAGWVQESLAAGRLQFVHRRQDYDEVCGGEASAHRGAGQRHERGRCSTCRIRILGDLSALPPANAAGRYVVIMFVDLCGSSKGACPSTRSSSSANS